MKLEESQIQYDNITREIIGKQERRIELRRKLQDSNEKYQLTGLATFKPWEFKNLNDEISILEDEITSLREKRDLISRGGTIKKTL